MFKNIFAALFARFNTKDFDSAIASFNKAVDNLQAVATKQLIVASAAVKAKQEADARLAAATAAAAEATAEANAKQLLAEAEAARATAAADKIKALIGSV